MALPDPERARGWGGRLIVDRDDAAIGPCTQVYTDDATGLPEWATARVGTLRVLLPLVHAVEDGGRVRVVVGRDEAMLAPRPAGDGHLSPDQERRLYRHYGIDAATDRSATLLPAGEGPAPPAPRRDPVALVAVVSAAAATAMIMLLSRRRRRRAGLRSGARLRSGQTPGGRRRNPYRARAERGSGPDGSGRRRP
jgi:hypothetical protein